MKTIPIAFRKAVYVSFVLIISLIDFLMFHEVFKMYIATPAEIKEYPFGTEMGWNYLSKEVYTADVTIWSYIFTQALIISFIFYRSGREVSGIASLLAPAIFLYFMTPRFY